MTKRFKTGTPSNLEWSGPWLSNIKDGIVTPEEYENVFSELMDALLAKFGEPTYPNAIYVWGDYYGDRSQELIINRANLLTEDLLEWCSDWLRQNAAKWRIIIPTTLDDKENYIIVYPDVLRCDSIEPDIVGRLNEVQVKFHDYLVSDGRKAD